MQRNGCGFMSPVVVSILITEAAERFAYYGFRAILVLYFTESLGYTDETAIALFAYVTCLAYSSPLLGSILADSLLGRYKTILWFGWIYVVGLAVLTAGAYLATAATNADANADADADPSLRLQRGLSFLGLILVCLGTGGIKPCVSAFGADQVAHADNQQQQSHTIGDTVVTESQSLSSSGESVRAFFASFYFCINLGAVTSFAIIPIVRAHFDFGTAFLLPTIFTVIAMLTFLSRRKEYVHEQRGDSSLLNTFLLCFWLLRKRLSQHRWLVRCVPCIRPTRAPIPGIDNQVDAAWGNHSHPQQLADAIQALRVFPILAMFPIFWMLYDQQSSVWTLQAKRMKLHGLQPEQLNAVNPIEIMIFIPLFDRIVYPFVERQRGGVPLSHTTRMAWGMVLTAVAFFTSGVLESYIRSQQQQHPNNEENSVSVFWQLPQITILSIAEIFLSVTGLEFAYSTSPERMKAFLMGIYHLTTALGDFLGGVLYSSVFQGLDRATILHICAGLMLANLCLFHFVSRNWESRQSTVAPEDIEMRQGYVSGPTDKEEDNDDDFRYRKTR